VIFQRPARKQFVSRLSSLISRLLSPISHVSCSFAYLWPFCCCCCCCCCCCRVYFGFVLAVASFLFFCFAAVFFFVVPKSVSESFPFYFHPPHNNGQLFATGCCIVSWPFSDTRSKVKLMAVSFVKSIKLSVIWQIVWQLAGWSCLILFCLLRLLLLAAAFCHLNKIANVACVCVCVCAMDLQPRDTFVA